MDDILAYAVIFNYEKLVTYTLNHGVSVEAMNNALKTACQQGRKKIVEILIAYGVDVQANGNAALYWAQKMHQQEIAQILLANGAHT